MRAAPWGPTRAGSRRGLRLLAVSGALAATPLGAQERPTLLVRAGAADGPGALAPVHQVAIAPRGEILVVQPSVPAIAVFDSTGRYLRDLGRAGGGPGEFRGLANISRRGDSLSVMDPAGMRLHLFGPDLSFVRTITPVMPPPPPGSFAMVPGPLLADGSILGIVLTNPGERSQPLPLMSESGTILRQLGTMSLGTRDVLIPLAGGQAREVRNPWDASPLWTVAADGSAVIVATRPVPTDADEGRFEILRIGLSGDTVFRRSFTYEPVAMDPGDAEREQRRIAGSLARGPLAEVGAERMLEDVRSGLPAPDFYPPSREIVAGADGSVWLRRHLPEGEWAQWEVFAADGERLRQVNLPSGFRVHGADARRVWGVQEGDLDIPFVEVYRLEGGAR